MVNLNLNLWVLLAILAMIACGILGLVVGIDHVGPGQALRAEQEGTRNAVNVRATEAVLAATQTPQAIYVGMAADEARMTAYPVSLTATRAAEAVNAQYEQATATQNARNEDERNRQAAGEATRASIHQQMTVNASAFSATLTAMAALPPAPEKADNGSVLGLIGAAAAGSWVIGRAWTQVSKARAQEKLAEAHREMMKKKSLKAQNQSGSGRDIPSSASTTRTNSQIRRPS
jgi:hypothetical protein